MADTSEDRQSKNFMNEAQTTSRQIRIAKNTVKHNDERMSKAPEKAEVHRKRYERAVAFLATLRLTS